jgi:Rap1a immunity proteins
MTLVVAALFSTILSLQAAATAPPQVAELQTTANPVAENKAPAMPQANVSPNAAALTPMVQPRTEIGYLTAGTLAERCQDSAPANINYCFAYIASVHDTMRAYEIWLEQREFCIPEKNAQGDLRRAFLTYLSAYPQNSNGQAASVVVVALKQTYPCIDAPTAIKIPNATGVTPSPLPPK